MENKELELLENKDIRESLMERIEVLNKVKELLLLPIGEYATTELVAQYFEVTVEVIKMQLNRNKDEFISDGYKVWKRKELQNLDSNLNLLSKRGTFAIVDKDGNEILTAPNTGLALWTPRSILRMGMLLRDSRVAKEIRNQLLNAFEVAKEKDESIKRFTLGTWDNDGNYRLFKTLGAKKYCYHKNKVDKKTGINKNIFEITVSGMSKSKGAKAVHCIKNFEIGRTYSDIGRTTSWYNDVKPHKITIEGCTFTTASNIGVLETTYTLGVTNEYWDLIGGNSKYIE